MGQTMIGLNQIRGYEPEKKDQPSGKTLEDTIKELYDEIQKLKNELENEKKNKYVE